MAVNPLYAQAIAKQNGEGGGGNFEKLPNIKLENIGSKFKGVVARVGAPFDKENEYKGEKRMVTTQVVEYTNVVVVQVDDDGNEMEPVKLDKANFWYQKTGHFAAIGLSLMDIEKDEIPVGATHMFKWSGLGKAVGDGARPHKFVSKFEL